MILKILGKNSVSDSDSFWISFGVFLNIINNLKKNSIKDISNEEIREMIEYLANNLAETIFERVKDESFFKSFPDVLIHRKYIPYIANIMGIKKHFLLHEYLLKTSAKRENLTIVNHVLEVKFEESFDFVYALVAAELFKSDNNSANKRKNLTSFLDFVTKKKLMAKTYIFILKSILENF